MKTHSVCLCCYVITFCVVKNSCHRCLDKSYYCIRNGTSKRHSVLMQIIGRLVINVTDTYVLYNLLYTHVYTDNLDSNVYKYKVMLPFIFKQSML